MKRESLVFISGFLLVILPFLGVPNMWKRIAYVALGAILILIGYQLRRAAYVRSIPVTNGEYKTEVYVESGAPRRAQKVKVEPVMEPEVSVETFSEIKVRRSRTTRV